MEPRALVWLLFNIQSFDYGATTVAKVSLCLEVQTARI